VQVQESFTTKDYFKIIVDEESGEVTAGHIISKKNVKKAAKAGIIQQEYGFNASLNVHNTLAQHYSWAPKSTNVAQLTQPPTFQVTRPKRELPAASQANKRLKIEAQLTDATQTL
jgi:hypothetical protein